VLKAEALTPLNKTADSQFKLYNRDKKTNIKRGSKKEGDNKKDETKKKTSGIKEGKGGAERVKKKAITA
jgi:hypothetical protein